MNPAAQRRRDSNNARDAAENARLATLRVNRDPCPRCNIRGDIGCAHSRAPLMVRL